LALYQATTTHDYPDRAAVMAALGYTLTKLGNYAEAERNLREALDIERRVFGPTDRRIAEIQSTFGAVYEHQGDLPRAIEAAAEAASIWSQSRGKDNYLTGWYLEGLARLYLKAGNVAAAETNLRAAMTIYAASLPARHLYIAAAHGELGEIDLRTVLISAGKFAEGEALLKAAQSALLAGVGPRDEATQEATDRLAEYYRAHRRDDEADKTQAALAIK
jgi:tetratricopeptide (TPR) repeat protein